MNVPEKQSVKQAEAPPHNGLAGLKHWQDYVCTGCDSTLPGLSTKAIKSITQWPTGEYLTSLVSEILKYRMLNQHNSARELIIHLPQNQGNKWHLRISEDFNVEDPKYEVKEIPAPTGMNPFVMGIAPDAIKTPQE